MTAAPTLELPLLDVHHGDPALVRDLLARPGALEHGHYQLLSGLHADTFMRFSALAHDEEALVAIADWLTPSLKPWAADAVLAPATAGVALGWTLARRLSVPLHLATLGADGRASEIPASDAVVGQRILLVNDIVTTGDGMDALAHLVADAGASIAGATWFASRSTVDVEAIIAAPIAYVVTLELGAVEPSECALCRDEVPVERAADLN